jgi:hypothetical protein
MADVHSDCPSFHSLARGERLDIVGLDRQRLNSVPASYILITVHRTKREISRPIRQGLQLGLSGVSVDHNILAGLKYLAGASLAICMLMQCFLLGQDPTVKADDLASMRNH